MRKTERIILEATLENVQLIIRMQKVAMSTINQIDEIIAEIGLMDARIEMLEKQR